MTDTQAGSAPSGTPALPRGNCRTDLSAAAREENLTDLVSAAYRLLHRRDRPGRSLGGDDFDAWEDDVREWLSRARPSSLRKVGVLHPSSFGRQRMAVAA